jgi:hypothetical protein
MQPLFTRYGAAFVLLSLIEQYILEAPVDFIGKFGLATKDWGFNPVLNAENLCGVGDD